MILKDNLVALLGRVAVICGGRSSERQVSLWSGEAIVNALRSKGVDVVAIDPMETDCIAELHQQRVDRVFIALHGKDGEDGTLQGLLNYLKLPYTGSDVLASAIGMNKVMTKRLWQAAGLPVLPSYVVDTVAELEKIKPQLPFPVAVKPIAEGSSIGVTCVEHMHDLEAAWQLASSTCQQPVLIEPWVRGGEFTAVILAGQSLPLIRMETDLAFYDFEAKYLREDTRYFCPSGLPIHLETRYQQIALRAFEVIQAKTWGRVDFVVDSEEQPWLLEINTVPGMTTHSLVPMAANAVGIDFPTLCLLILQDTLTMVE